MNMFQFSPINTQVSHSNIIQTQMDSIIKNFTSFRHNLNTSFLNVPMQFTPFAAFIAGILMHKGLDTQIAVNSAEEIEHLYSVKKVIVSEEYKCIIQAICHKPQKWKSIQDKVLIPKAARQKIDVQSVLDKIVNENNESDAGTEPLDQETIEMLNQFNKEDMIQKKKKQEQERQTLELIQKLQKQDMELRDKSDVEGEDCEICMSGLYEQNAEPFPLEKCGHVFHIECIRSCLNALISQRKFPLTCPNDSCLKQIVQRDINSILSSQNIQKYQQFTFKNYLDMNSDSVSWCPTAGCKYVFFFSPDDKERFQCQQCHKQYCLVCKVSWHRNMTCKQYQISNNFSADDQKFLKFVNGNHYKQCPKCKFFVEKTMGCDHMVCRCKYEFCYKCGGKYMDCECTRENNRRMEERRLMAERRREKKKLKMEAINERKNRKAQQAEEDKEEPRPRRNARRK